jgi:hypothetical protein
MNARSSKRDDVHAGNRVEPAQALPAPRSHSGLADVHEVGRFSRRQQGVDRREGVDDRQPKMPTRPEVDRRHGEDGVVERRELAPAAIGLGGSGLGLGDRDHGSISAWAMTNP